MNPLFNLIHIKKPHISLNVIDINKSVEFYSKMFQVSPVKLKEDYAKFDLDFPSLNLTLNKIETVKNESKVSHFGIEVSSSKDVLLLKSIWENSGIKNSEEESINCCYAIQDKVWIEDPDQNSWEAFVVLENSDTKVTNTCCN